MSNGRIDYMNAAELRDLEYSGMKERVDDSLEWRKCGIQISDVRKWKAGQS